MAGEDGYDNLSESLTETIKINISPHYYMAINDIPTEYFTIITDQNKYTCLSKFGEGIDKIIKGLCLISTYFYFFQY